jgi:hypothetical protein
MFRRKQAGAAVETDAATLQLGEGKRCLSNLKYSIIPFLDFNSTHCLMNSEVKLLLDTYMQKRVDETGGYVQPNA